MNCDGFDVERLHFQTLNRTFVPCSTGLPWMARLEGEPVRFRFRESNRLVLILVLILFPVFVLVSENGMRLFLSVIVCLAICHFGFLVAGVPQNASAQDSQKSGSDDKHSSHTVSLLKGDSLEQFQGYKNEKVGAGWKLKGGVLTFDGSGGGDIVTRESFDNFELTFDWKVNRGANSGVMYRVSMGDGAPYLSGPEFQILDDANHNDGRNEKTSAGSLYALYKPSGQQLKPVGQWNTAKIVLNGNHVEHWLNGKKVVDAEIGGDDWNERVAASKFRNWEKFGKNKSGRICFQDHGDEVAFRNIHVKRLGK